jgi:hypothetical protein
VEKCCRGGEATDGNVNKAYAICMQLRQQIH